jgi:heterodisulfide reductase subunit A-like polyferredoxin
MAAVVNAENCTGCEECVSTCPLDAIKVADGKATIDDQTCGDCGACVDGCPSEAISMA